MGDHDLADRLEDWPYSKPAFSKSECLEAAARLRHLDRILDAIGNPEKLASLALSLGEKGWTIDADYLNDVAAAVRDTDRDTT